MTDYASKILLLYAWMMASILSLKCLDFKCKDTLFLSVFLSMKSNIYMLVVMYLSFTSGSTLLYIIFLKKAYGVCFYWMSCNMWSFGFNVVALWNLLDIFIVAYEISLINALAFSVLPLWFGRMILCPCECWFH